MNPSMERHLHLISFDIPYPADYGGVIDVFYKIKALFNLGINVHLHAYEYGRGHAEELDKYCFSVDYYIRPKGLAYAIKSIPYIIATRNSERLLENLLKDEYPILFEGIHTCLLMNRSELASRKKYVRAHNVEHDYYRYLSKSTRSIYKSMFFNIEARKLKKYEQIISKADAIFPISVNDLEYFKSLYSNVILLPAFHESDQILSLSGRGDYLVYHGNLSVEENEKAALFLIQKVFSRISTRCILTGKNPSTKLLEAAANIDHIEIIANPSDRQIHQLIQEAHINVLPTFQDTGIKLKLLKSFSTGRFCLGNSMMVKNTGLEDLCSIKEEAEEMIQEIGKLMELEFSPKMIMERQALWDQLFSKERGAHILMNEIFPSLDSSERDGR